MNGNQFDPSIHQTFNLPSSLQSHFSPSERHLLTFPFAPRIFSSVPLRFFRENREDVCYASYVRLSTPLKQEHHCRRNFGSGDYLLCGRRTAHSILSKPIPSSKSDSSNVLARGQLTTDLRNVDLIQFGYGFDVLQFLHGCSCVISRSSQRSQIQQRQNIRLK